MVADAGFGGILLKVATAARRPCGLILSLPSDASAGSLSSPPPVFRAVQFVVVDRVVLDVVLYPPPRAELVTP
jgi:hypothetical protein